MMTTTMKMMAIEDDDGKCECVFLHISRRKDNVDLSSFVGLALYCAVVVSLLQKRMCCVM